MTKLLKRFFAVFLAVIMVFGASPLGGLGSQYLSVSAYVPLTLGDLAYEVADGEVTIIDCNDAASGVITIPSEIDNFPVTAIGYDAFYGCDFITGVTIPESVKSISDEAFYGCTGLISMTIPGSVESIGYGAFYWCTALSSVTLSEGIKEIGDEAFYNCTSLLSVTIPSSLTSMGDWTFYHCTSLASLTIQEGATSIGCNSFDECSSLASVTIPSSVTYIGDCAFYGCSMLASITVNAANNYYSSDEFGVLFNKDKTTLIQYPIGNTRTLYQIPEGVKEVSDSAFCACTNLVDVTIAEGLTYIGEYAFLSCTSLTGVTIPGSVTRIGYQTFALCSSLVSITIPEGVTKIGASAFAHCTSLVNITIPSSVTIIGYDAFYNTAYYNNSVNWINYVLYIDNCLIRAKDSLSGSYIIAAGTRVVAGNAFFNCTSLTGITIPEGVKSLGDNAFYNCTSLSSVTIPEGVTSIGYYAFSICTALEFVTIPSSVAFIDNYAFYKCNSLESITVDSANNYYSSDEFGVLFNKNKTSLIHYPKGNGRASYQIPEGVESIENCIFAYCTSLTGVTIPSSVTQIGYQAFFACSSLASINIPEGVTSIKDEAFKDCTSLANISIPSSVTNIGNNAFHNTLYYNNAANWTSDVLYIDNCLIKAKDSLSGSYVVASGTCMIADYAFNGCASLVSLTIPEGVTSIGYSAFCYCNTLADITIPTSVTSIGDDAFYYTAYYNDQANWTDDVLYIDDCLIEAHYSLNGSYTIAVGTRLIADYAFSDCYYIEGLTIPEGVTDIGESAFNYCESLEDITIPSSVTSIGDWAFYYCVALKSITVDSANNYYSSDEFGVLYNKDKTHLIQYPLGNSRAAYKIPIGVTSIEEYAFSYCNYLAYVHIPPSVTTIGDDLLYESVAYICSDTDDCYAKIYADEWDYRFAICDGHPIAVTGVMVEPTSKTLIVGGTQQLTATVAPENATNSAVTYASSNTAVATVSATGLITAVSAGTATITVTTADGNKIATCAVTVIAPSVEILNLNNSATINYGDTLKLTAITENLPDGAYIEWSVEGSGVSISQTASGDTCSVTSTGKGTVTVTATVVDANGNPILSGGNEITASQTITSKAGFFQKLISFFKNLFGALRIFSQAFRQDIH